MTIDGLIAELQASKEKRGGDAPVFVKDADTGLHLLMRGIRESNKEPGKILLHSEDYAGYFNRKEVVT